MNHVRMHFLAACEALRIDPASVLDNLACRDGEHPRTRGAVYAWMRDNNLRGQQRPPSLPEIGALFGKNHSTVVTAINRHRERQLQETSA